MAKQLKLKARRRSVSGSSAVKKLRAAGDVPAVIYGADTKAENLQVSAQDLSKLLSQAVGEHLLVELEFVDGNDTGNRTALIQDVQHSVVGGDILHVDFQAVSMDKPIQAEVPLQPVGEANGVKNFGGILEQNIRALEIECLPRDLPELIEVDVSNLNLGDAIHVSDVKLPPGVTCVADAELTVFLVSAPRVEEEVVVAQPAAAPEVIREKKEEGGEPPQTK
jgi:large subunit ribosomal protein L25